jgi:hypothetical protein
MPQAVLKPFHIGLFLVALVGVFVAIWPTGIGRDYLNHLARTHIEGHLAGDETLQQFFGLSFDFIPDLTMDMIVPWLSHLIGTYNAGAVTIWLAFMLAPLAGMALSKTLHGRVTWPSLLGLLTAFNVNMDWGFVNYNASAGLALFAFVLWIRMPQDWKRTLVFLPIGLFLCANHAIAFLIFGFLAVSWELISYANGERGNRFRLITRAALFDLTAMLGGLIFLYLSLQTTSDLPKGTSDFFSLEQKAYVLSSATEFNNRLLGMLTGLILLGGVFFVVRKKWIIFAPKTGWLCLAFLGLVILMPTSVLGIWGLHLRVLPTLIILIGACAIPTADFNPPRQQVIAITASAFAAILFTNGAYQMAKIDAVVTDTRALLENVPRGSRVLTAIASDNVPYAALMNASATVVIDRSGYVPGLFTNTSPVDIAPAYANLHMPQSQPLKRHQMLTNAHHMPSDARNDYWNLGYADGWPQTFDYLLYYKSETDPAITELDLCPVAQTPRIILYATKPCTRNG